MPVRLRRAAALTERQTKGGRVSAVGRCGAGLRQQEHHATEAGAAPAAFFLATLASVSSCVEWKWKRRVTQRPGKAASASDDGAAAVDSRLAPAGRPRHFTTGLTGGRRGAAAGRHLDRGRAGFIRLIGRRYCLAAAAVVPAAEGRRPKEKGHGP